MKKISVLSILILALAVMLTACGNGEETAEVDPAIAAIGDPARGEELFQQNVIGGNMAGCITCHSLEPGVTIVGPPQHDIGFRAPQRVSGMSGEEYLRESIVEPDAYVVDGFQPGTMTQGFGEALTEQEINDLIAYMLTLKG